MQTPMQDADVPIPFLGVSDATTFKGQPGTVTDPDGLRNVVPRNVESGRGQLATRPKVAVVSSAGAFTGPVQAIESIPQSTGISGVTLTDEDTSTSGVSIVSSDIRGQGVIIDPDGSIALWINDSRGTGFTAPPSGPGGWGAFMARWHSTNPSIGYIATIARDTTVTTQNKVVCGLTRFDTSTGLITHSTYAVDAAPGYSAPLPSDPPGPVQRDLFVNHLVQAGGYLFVAADEFVYCFSAEDLTYVNRYPMPWTGEVQSLAAIDLDRSYLIVAGTGNPTVYGAVVADGGPAPTERFGEFYRTSLMPFRIDHANEATDSPLGSGGNCLTQRGQPMGLASGDPGFEDHRAFRFSEWSLQRPRGCLVYAIDAEVDPSGTIAVYCVRTNQGFGYNGADANQRPDGSVPNVSVCKVILTRGFEAGAPISMPVDSPVRYGMSAEVGGWERDVGSLRRAFAWGSNTYQNDIPSITAGLRNPHATDNEPTLFAIKVDRVNRRVFCGGRSPSLSTSQPNLFCFDADSGALLWSTNTGGKIQQNALAVDPTTGDVLVGIMRSAGYTQADGSAATAQAEMLRIEGGSGLLLSTFDLTDNVTFNGFVGPWSMAGAYAVDVNSRGEVLVGLAPYRYDV